MRDYLAHEVRNVTVLGHSGAGKTAVLEAMLHFTKATDRFGKTSEGSSIIDYDPEEIRRGLSVYTSIVPIEWKDTKINFIDTPGYLDFVGEMESGCAAGDNILIVVGAKEGVQSGTQRAWEVAMEKKLPTIFFVNKVDEEHASFDKAYESLREAFGKSVIPFEVPILENDEVIGSINILRDKAWYFKGDKADRNKSYEVPDNMKEVVADYKNQIAEAIAMGDDDLMEKFFSGEPFTEAELTRGVRLGVRNGEIRPVFSGSAINMTGIERLLDLIDKYFPTYGEQGTITVTDIETNEPVELLTDEKGDLTAQVFKTIVDPFVGRISFLKVRSGVLSSDTTLYNPKKDKMEKISQIFIIKGKHQTAVGKLFTGDIGAVTKLAYTQTNDTLCEKGKHYVVDEIKFSEPMLGVAVWPKSKNDDDKLSNALNRMCEEDPTTRLVNNKETKENILYGVGDQHIDVIVNKMKSKYKVEVNLTTPKVPYHETIRKTVIGEGRHKKQSGGHGQFGHVFVEFSPNPDSEDMVFEETVFGGAVPKQYFPAVETGLRECMAKGYLAGYRMVNVKANLKDGKYHDVDSSEMAFKLAAHLAFKDAMPKAGCILLEPIVSATVVIPDEYTGTIIGDFNKRRGTIMGMDMEGDHQVINALVPLAEMMKYPTDLRSMTQGRGKYTQVFDHYDPVPANIAEKIIANAHKSDDDGE
ncbi:elongation factor G [uncultured Traorella sp.]|jgi:elongation factor G|uniref:elongation factor G n=1 Tax=uncultured Traorella sp. TaxID=1929048 RepID=UPI0025E38C89|nr:elongation factor G [uncultured Traorella sp.]